MASTTSTTVSFQKGVGGYAGTVDTNLRAGDPTTVYAGATQLFTDSDSPNGAGTPAQALLRFDNLFGTGAGQIPLGAHIASATLTLQTSDIGDGAELHRMLKSWADTDTWSSLSNGVQADGVEAVASADLVTGRMAALGSNTFDVSASLQAWSNGAANLGWAFLPSGTDGWGFQSAEGSPTPKLTITYDTGTPPSTGPSLSLSGAPSLAEGNSGSTPFAFTATRSGDTSVAASAAWMVAGSGTNPVDAADFAGGVLPSGTVSFAAGETSKTITVNIAGDTTVEPDETFALTLSNPSAGATITTAKATGTILNDDAAAQQPPFDESYIATTFSGGRLRVLEHDNATKSVFVDGHWYAVLPDGAKWSVERFDGPIPSAGQEGGWTKASTDHFLDTNRSSDIAWDGTANNLYVLQFYDQSSKPRMFDLHYDAGTHAFSEVTEAQIAGVGGKLAATHWGNNAELVIGMDQFNTPLVADVGTATSGSNEGVHLAWTSKDLATWGDTTIDPDPTAAGGNSKVDIVAFTQGGVQRIGLAYSADSPSTPGVTGDVWKFAWHDAASNPANYASGWHIETFNNTVAIDNHISTAWDGSNVFIAMKDDHNAVWLTKGLPGNWETVKVANGDTDPTADRGPSRPTLVVDKADDRILVFYQQHTTAPLGDIYMKSASLDGSLSFDPTDPGTRVLHTYSGSALVDPQPPLQPIDASMDNAFYLFARNEDAPEIWYNRIDLGASQLIA